MSAPMGFIIMFHLGGWRTHSDEATIPMGCGSAQYPDRLCEVWAQDVAAGLRQERSLAWSFP